MFFKKASFKSTIKDSTLNQCVRINKTIITVSKGYNASAISYNMRRVHVNLHNTYDLIENDINCQCIKAPPKEKLQPNTFVILLQTLLMTLGGICSK